MTPPLSTLSETRPQTKQYPYIIVFDLNDGTISDVDVLFNDIQSEVNKLYSDVTVVSQEGFSKSHGKPLLVFHFVRIDTRFDDFEFVKSKGERFQVETGLIDNYICEMV